MFENSNNKAYTMAKISDNSRYGGSKGFRTSVNLNSNYVRIELLANGFTLTAAEKPQNDGCFYSRFSTSSSCVYLPEKMIDCYTNNNRSIAEASLIRRPIKNGYKYEAYGNARKIQQFNKNFATGKIVYDYEMPDFSEAKYEVYNNFKNTTKAQRKDHLMYFKNNVSGVNSAILSCSKKLKGVTCKYLICDLYLGKSNCVIITPQNHLPEDILSLNEIRDIMKTDMSCFLEGHIRYYFESDSKGTLIPKQWYDRAQVSKLIVSVANDKSRILIQGKSECVIDKKHAVFSSVSTNRVSFCHECSFDSSDTSDTVHTLINTMNEVFAHTERSEERDYLLSNLYDYLSREVTYLNEEPKENVTLCSPEDIPY